MGIADATEPFFVPDVVVTEICDVEKLGTGMFRFTFASKQKMYGKDNRVIVARLVCSLEHLPAMIAVALKAGEGQLPEVVARLN